MPGRVAATHGEQRTWRVRWTSRGVPRWVSTVPTTARPLIIVTAIALGTLAGAVSTVLDATGSGPRAAYAQPCGPTTPGTRITDLPWAQQRLAPERLAPLADGTGVTVAVIDSGVDTGHPQLRGRVRQGADFLDPQRPNGTLDCNGHGTAVASLIVAGPPPGGIAFRGLAPGARVVPVRVSEQETIDGETTGRTVSTADFARAIRWAVDQGDADVINLSLVLTRDDPAVRAAIRYAVDQDVVVVAAAGNDKTEGNPTSYPAGYDGVLGVGAVGETSIREDYSQTGDYVDLVAPGGGIIVASPGGGYTVQKGTSFAAPFVAATAALVRQYRPELTAEEVIRQIVATTDPAPGGNSDEYGSGVVNPFRAVTETIASGDPDPAQPLPTRTVDPQVVAKERELARNRQDAMLMAGVGGVVAVLILVTAVVLPRGVRRRWRPAEPA